MLALDEPPRRDGGVRHPHHEATQSLGRDHGILVLAEHILKRLRRCNVAPSPASSAA